MKRKYQTYSESSLANALKAIREDNLSFRAASREFGVPITTLHDRIKGKTADGLRRMGPSTVLTESEELKIVEWLINIAKCGFPQKINELLDVVQKIVRDEKRITPFKDDRPGKKWYYNFLSRHKELSLRVSESLCKGRAIVTEEAIRKWFQDLKNYLREINATDILDDPTRIFNGDETSFSLAPKTGKVIGPRGFKNLYEIKLSNEKENLTVLLVFSANGVILPPEIVFPYLRNPPSKLVQEMPKDWIIGRSETGWMRSETFFEYVANDFSGWLDRNNIKRPVLLLVDGHKSHLSMAISEFCSNNEIILYSLPPNTTHIMQPADVGAFKGIKSDYKVSVREWQSLPENLEKTVTKTNFCQILKMVLDKKDRSEMVRNAFRKCGIYPFDPNAVDYSKCLQNNLENFEHVTADTAIDKKNAEYVQRLDTTVEVLSSLKNELLNNGINFELLLQTVADVKIRCQVNLDRNDFEATQEAVENHDVVLDKINVDLIQPTNEDNEPGSPQSLTLYSSTVEFEGLQDVLNEILVEEHIPDGEVLNPLSLVSPRLTNSALGPSTSRLTLDSPSSSRSSFDKYLKYPKPITTKRGKELLPVNRQPMSISSGKWQEFFANRENMKQKKKNDIQTRKQQRADRKKKLAGKKTKITKNNQKQSCGCCEDELDTDAEEDGLKNIGCDKCQRWFHLSCTDLCRMTFEDAQNEEFVCVFCT